MEAWCVYYEVQTESSSASVLGTGTGFSSNTSAFHLFQSPTSIFFKILLLSEGQAGDASEISKATLLFWIWGSIGKKYRLTRTFTSFFFQRSKGLILKTASSQSSDTVSTRCSCMAG
jgi:hypothetical protein